MRNRINIPKNMFSTKRIAKELFQSKRKTEGNILTNNTLSFCIKGSFFNSDNALGYDLVFREEKVKVEISRAFISNIILNSGCAWSVYWRLLSSFYLWTFFTDETFSRGRWSSTTGTWLTATASCTSSTQPNRQKYTTWALSPMSRLLSWPCFN